jgi:hypothetical protein
MMVNNKRYLKSFCCIWFYLLQLSVVVRPYDILWEQDQKDSVYSSVGIVGNPSLQSSRDEGEDNIHFAAATWDSGYNIMEVFSPQSKNATANWEYKPSTPTSSLAVATSRHIDFKSSGPVNLVVANFFRGIMNSCVLLGFNSDSVDANPIWQYNVPGNCSVNLALEGDSQPTLKFSDDGSTVVFAVSIFDPINETNTPQLHCIDGQNGSLNFVYELINEEPGTNSVSLSRDGSRIAYGNGLIVYVLEKSTGHLLTKPLVRQVVSDVHICPMGVFLLYAINQGSVVRRFNETSKEFEVTPYQPKTPPGEPNSWIAVSHSTSVNGEGKSPSGCLCAVGWMGLGANQGIAKLEVFSMLTGEIFVEWTSTNKGMGYENFPIVAMHLGYVALGTWGNSNPANEANIFLFHTDTGNTTVMEYSSKGSIMAIDMIYAPYSLPPLVTARKSPHINDAKIKYDNPSESQAYVYLIAAGKLTHANIPSIGGQCTAFKIPVTARPPPPL